MQSGHIQYVARATLCVHLLLKSKFHGELSDRSLGLISDGLNLVEAHRQSKSLAPFLEFELDVPRTTYRTQYCNL